MGFHLDAVRQGRIPPYFNPVEARGEDAILGTQIQDVSFHRVPVCTFHDPFQQYVEITRGQFPESLHPMPTTPSSLDRFCRAFLGWLRYAPLLLRLTTDDAREYEDKINQMRRMLGCIGLQLDTLSGWHGFHRAEETLNVYYLQCLQDLHDMYRAQEAWAKITKKL